MQSLVLPPWVEVGVVVNPFFSPFASAALEANANKPTSRKVGISRVMGFLRCRESVSGPNTVRTKSPIWALPRGPHLQAARQQPAPGPPRRITVHQDCFADVPLPSWAARSRRCSRRKSVLIPIIVLSASATSEANANESASRRAEISHVTSWIVHGFPPVLTEHLDEPDTVRPMV